MFHDFLEISDWCEVKVFVFVDDLESWLLIKRVFVSKFPQITSYLTFLLLISESD